jgi:hypothetical protein
MKPIGTISAAALLLLFGAVAPSYAIQDQHEQEAKPPKQEPAKPEKQEEAKPPKQEPQAKPEKQQDAKPPKQESQAKPEKQQEPKAAKQQPQAKPEKQQQAKAAKPAPQAKPEKQEEAKAAKPAREQPAKAAKQAPQSKAGNQQHAQRTEAEQQRQRAVPALRLSARGTGRIPDDRFRSSFGESHTFVINEPVLVGGYSRFQYSGFWFGFVEPWPDGWYYTDNVYVDYVDGEYFLINPYYPGARVGISVIL